MTRIKICGITNLDDALAAIEAGADMLGFVVAESPRRVAPATAKAIIEKLPPEITPVFVFKDQTVQHVKSTADSVVRVVQLHGDESPEMCDELPFDVIRRIAVGDGDTAADLAARIGRFRAAGFLLDPGAGSGLTFRWEIARGLGPRIYLAGGLTPTNVAEAIRIARPYAVDVSSGVEQSPGRKDRNKMTAFVRAVRESDANNDA